jgi:transposase-like protein
MATKFTEETQQIILEALRNNPSVPSAASKAGIAATTLNKWLHEGLEGVEKYQAFALEAAEARRAMKDSVVAALYKTATDELHPQQTKAAHLLLTNLYPTEFANVKHTVSHKPTDPEINLSALSIDEKRAFHKTLKQIVSGDDDAASAITVINATSPKAQA